MTLQDAVLTGGANYQHLHNELAKALNLEEIEYLIAKESFYGNTCSVSSAYITPSRKRHVLGIPQPWPLSIQPLETLFIPPKTDFPF